MGKLINLTDTQERVLLHVLEKVNHNLYFDPDFKMYIDDGGDLTITLSPSDKRSLARGIEALLSSEPTKRN